MQCLLFNDLLVFALGDTSKSTVELQLPLESVWIADLEDLDPATCEAVVCLPLLVCVQ